MAAPVPEPRNVSLPGGVRPAESLWSVLNRLIWMHRPGVDELLDIFNIRRQRWPDLLTGRDAESSPNAAKPRFLIAFLGMTERQFDAALLPPYLVSPVRLVYCKSCAVIGYHSIVFQLPGMNMCPIHQERLLKHCRHCSSPITTILGPAMITHPYACAACGASLINRRVDFFHGRTPREIASLNQIMRWLQQLTRKVVAWGDLRTAYHYRVDAPDASVNDAQLLALAASCQKRVPSNLAQLQKEETWKASFYFPFSAQPAFPAKVSVERLAFAGMEDSVRIYRVYLKSLRKRYFSPAFLKAMRRRNFSLWATESIRRYSFEVAVAYAILLLRSRCEGWSNSDPLRKDPERFLLSNQVRSRDLKHGYTLLLPRSSHDWQDDGVRVDLEAAPNPLRAWIVGHWQLMEYACLFAEAMLFASEQLKQGHFECSPKLQGRLVPDLFALVRDEPAGAYRLDFWRCGRGNKSVYQEEAQFAEAKQAYYSCLANNLR